MPMWYEEDSNKMKESGKDMGETDPKKLESWCRIVYTYLTEHRYPPLCEEVWLS